MYQIPPVATLKASRQERAYSKFYREVLETPLRVDRSSWGAQHSSTRTVFSNIWVDQIYQDDMGQYAWFSNLTGVYGGRPVSYTHLRAHET